MNVQSMLDQLLRTGLPALDRKDGGGRAGMDWGQFGAGAATGGVLGLLLGSRRARGFGAKALKYGSVAALGALAWRAYSSWQEQQAREGAAAPAGAAPAVPRTVDRLPAPEAELHSRAMLQAMIAAAKADGHLDDRERGLVEAEIDRRSADPELRAWFETELRRPLDPAEVAQAATTPELAAEMYLASLLVADETSTMERLYLDELARQLRLPPGLKDELEVQARAA
jgi:uncharacterized membrane protein YebE (DUF533 family)